MVFHEELFNRDAVRLGKGLCKETGRNNPKSECDLRYVSHICTLAEAKIINHQR